MSLYCDVSLVNQFCFIATMLSLDKQNYTFKKSQRSFRSGKKVMYTLSRETSTENHLAWSKCRTVPDAQKWDGIFSNSRQTYNIVTNNASYMITLPGSINGKQWLVTWQFLTRALYCTKSRQTLHAHYSSYVQEYSLFDNCNATSRQSIRLRTWILVQWLFRSHRTGPAIDIRFRKRWESHDRSYESANPALRQIQRSIDITWNITRLSYRAI